MNVLRTGMNMSISRIHVWLCNIRPRLKNSDTFISQVASVFANGLRDWGLVPDWVIPDSKKWYLMPPCLIQHYKVSRVKWSSPGKGVAPSTTPWCGGYWKRSLQVTKFTPLCLFSSSIYLPSTINRSHSPLEILGLENYVILFFPFWLKFFCLFFSGKQFFTFCCSFHIQSNSQSQVLWKQDLWLRITLNMESSISSSFRITLPTHCEQFFQRQIFHLKKKQGLIH